jgi:hypothetical protein
LPSTPSRSVSSSSRLLSGHREAGLIANGHLKGPIAHVYPLAQVREAYTELELLDTAL